MVSPGAQRADLQRIPHLAPKGQVHPPGSLAAALSGQGGGIFSVPAHPLDERTGSGIRWTPEALELWLVGSRLDVAEVATESPLACWRDLAFVSAFPTVSHWWFGSSWTQRVRATAIKRLDGGVRLVWLQAVQDDADELAWSVAPDGIADGPLPEFAGDERNLPLRLHLGQLARLVAVGQVPLMAWAVVSSLVAAGTLPALLDGDRRDTLLTALGLAT